MFILGHIGLTVAGARAVDRGVDLRWAALLAILPDIIDKPIALLAPGLINHNTRNVGHSFLASLFVLAALWALRRRVKNPLLLWACYLGHFLLDRMWRSSYPLIMFWPLLGALPPCAPAKFQDLVYNIGGELAGLAILAERARRGGLIGRVIIRLEQCCAPYTNGDRSSR